MRIDLAKNSGFCGGVFRAFDLVEKKFKKKPSNISGVFILGSLAHNNSVVKKINQWDIKKIKSIRNIKQGSIVIITAHGASEEVLKNIKEKGGRIFDTTCPKVSRIHKLVSDYKGRGYEIIILGDKKHKEVKGINGWCGNSAIIITRISDAKRLVDKISKGKTKDQSFLLIAQTTQDIKKFKKIRKMFEAISKEKAKIKFFDTICRASYLRQEEAEKIAIRNEFVIILGGKESANTKRLWQTAKRFNSKTIWINEVDKIDKDKLIQLTKKSKSVGIITGASTPLWEIDELKKSLK